MDKNDKENNSFIDKSIPSCIDDSSFVKLDESNLTKEISDNSNSLDNDLSLSISNEATYQPSEYEADDTLKGKVKNKIDSRFLKTIINAHNSALLNTTAKSYDPVNIAHCLEDCQSEELLFFYKTCDPDISADIFTHLTYETKQKIIKAFTSKDIRALVDNLSTDDLVDFVDELPANLMGKILRSVSKDDRENVKAFLNLKDDTAGSLMTVEYLSIRKDKTIKDLKEKIKLYGANCETIWKIFLLDETKRLVGTINLDKIIENDDDTVLESIMTKDYISCNINTDQEVVLQAFRKYDTSIIPVLKSDNRMVGIITFDDVMDIQSEENSEDIYLQAGVIPTKKSYLQTNVFTLCRNYSLWLILLVILNTFTSMVLSRLQNLGALLLVPVLISILPQIMGTNGNSSDQTCTITIRELALGNITTKDYFKMMFKELRASLITGLILAIFSFGWMLVELYSGLIQLSNQDIAIYQSFYTSRDTFFISISLLVSNTFLLTTVLAKLLGVTLPILAKKIHLDPAVMAQPIVSTILDILSIVVYFLLTFIFIRV